MLCDAVDGLIVLFLVMMVKTIIHILESTEIQKKCLGLTTFIFWSGMPEGSQNCPYEKVWCVSWWEISILEQNQWRKMNCFKKRIILSIYSAGFVVKLSNWLVFHVIGRWLSKIYLIKLFHLCSKKLNWVEFQVALLNKVNYFTL